MFKTKIIKIFYLLYIINLMKKDYFLTQIKEYYLSRFTSLNYWKRVSKGRVFRRDIRWFKKKSLNKLNLRKRPENNKLSNNRKTNSNYSNKNYFNSNEKWNLSKRNYNWSTLIRRWSTKKSRNSMISFMKDMEKKM
jgi:hypothetical protein